jgi:hypothetical protein
MEELMIRALYYAQEKHGSYTDWFCLTLTSAIGNIPAGDYAISGLSVSSNTITIITTATAGSGYGTWDDQVEIYPFRIPSSADARHYSWAGHSMVAAGGDEHTLVAGLMRLDYMQSHWHMVYGNQTLSGGSRINTSTSLIVASPSNSVRWVGDATTAITDGISGVPRTDKRTHGSDVGVYTYIYAGTVN